MEYTHGGDIYRNRVKWDFSANIGPFGMPPSVREAAVRGVEDSQAYPDSQAEKLRKEIAQAEGADPEQIVCGNGAAEVIFHLAAAVRPRQALLLAPTFSEYERALTAVGCACHFYELKEENGFQVGEDFPAAITASTDMAVICNPNNPTGVLFPEKLYREVIKRCARTGCLLAVDECFQDFLETRIGCHSAQFGKRKQRSVIFSFSKHSPRCTACRDCVWGMESPTIRIWQNGFDGPANPGMCPHRPSMRGWPP